MARLDELIHRQQTYFMVATLEYLHKGGRIGGAKALLGEMLQVKPILAIRDGQVEPFEQQRTKRRAVARMVKIAVEQCRAGADAHLCVLHAAAEEDANALAADLSERLSLEAVPIYLLPPAIIVHVGPGTLGIAFFT